MAVFPDGAEIAAPYFVRTPTITPIDFSKPASGSLESKPGESADNWYAVGLKPHDYKVTAEFKRVDGKKTNIQAQVDIFGPIGEKVQNAPSRVCNVNVIDTSGACSVKLLMAQDAQVLFRLLPDDQTAFKTTFKIEPIE